MPKIERIFLVAVLFVTFSIIANAQGAVSYKFLEVVDYENKPVAEATAKHKADVNLGCKNGRNALKIVQEQKEYGYIKNADEIIKILTEAGAKE